jgi:hypothetical protein
MEQQEEIEINFRLEHGRTVPQLDARLNVDTAAAATTKIDYSSKTVSTTFRLEDKPHISGFETIVDELLFDAEISDSGLMPRTFWVPANGFVPRCSFEQIAFDVFEHHTKGAQYDPSCSGAEWWVQIRPSPEKTGRYAMHASSKDDGDPKDMATEGISFHWDKDEDLRLLCGGNTYVHPHISSVTYLTDIGAPTMVVNARVNNFTGEYIVEDEMDGFVSWPRANKHLSFDGRYLHAALSDLMCNGSFAAQIAYTIPNDDTRLANKLARQNRRVTFLVNVWLNFHPFNVHTFPETMLDKMSGQKQKERVGLRFHDAPDRSVNCLVSTSTATQFTWPLGDCGSGESIVVSMPLDEIRELQNIGGNMQLTWKGNEVQIVHDEVEDLKKTEECTKRPRLP